MKSILLTLATLTLASVASAAEATGIAPDASLNLYAAATPEPSHAMLLLIGCVGLAARRRR